MAYEDFKDLPRRTASDKVLLDKVFHIAKNPKHDGCQREIASMTYNIFFDKKSSGGGVNCEIIPKQQLSVQLHKKKY